LPESPCNKYLISAHRQSSLSRFPRRPVGQFGGGQKTDVCCTGFDIQLRRSIQSLAMSLKCSLFSVSYGPLGAHLLNGAAAPLAAVDGFDGTPSRTIPRSVLRRDRPFNRLSARPQVQRLQQSRLVIPPLFFRLHQTDTVCNKPVFSAHRQSSLPLLRGGPAGKPGRVQKTEVFGTGASRSATTARRE
jgi:hypothetical protein